MNLSKLKINKAACAVACLSIVLTGCSSVSQSTVAKKAGLFPDRENAYLGSVNLPPLKTPAGVPAIANDPYYTVPNTTAAQKDKISLLPPGSQAAGNTIAKPVANAPTAELAQ